MFSVVPRVAWCSSVPSPLSLSLVIGWRRSPNIRGVTVDLRLDLTRVGLPLCVHGEVTDADIDIFDREAVFIDRILEPLLGRLPALKVVFEHVPTKEAVDFVAAGDA